MNPKLETSGPAARPTAENSRTVAVCDGRTCDNGDRIEAQSEKSEDWSKGLSLDFINVLHDWLAFEKV